MVQTVWFKYNPIECQITPWQELGRNLLGLYGEHALVHEYFKSQGIIIIDARKTSDATSFARACGSPAGFAYFFLVSESDTNKMIKLGYKTFTIPLPSNAVPVQ